MAIFEAIWADDGWEGGEDADEHAFLSSCMQAIGAALDDADCRVEWRYYGYAAGAALEVARPQNDFRLAIVDFRFGTQGWDWSSVVDELRKRNVPYIVFTNFPADAEFTDGLRDDPLRLATLGKDAAGLGELALQVASFFRAPPIRILHLSDLHVRAEQGSDADEEARFTALYDCLRTESVVRPFDAAAFTGDFAGRDPVNDLSTARQRVRTLMEIAVLGDVERAFVIPGNHDVHWTDFARKELARHPWQPYLDFYQACFGARHALLAELRAWDAELRMIRQDSPAGALMWHRRLPAARLSVVGLATPVANPIQQGHGVFGREHADFLQQHWRSEPSAGEVRLALMHHNLFAVLSASAQDEQHTLEGAGTALKSLLSARCDLVLSGHTHTPTVMQSTAARLSTGGWSQQGSLTAVSAGTIGGVHPSLDRPRAFNIIEIGHGRPGEPRSLAVRTFVFDSGEGRWVALKAFAGLELRG